MTVLVAAWAAGCHETINEANGSNLFRRRRPVVHIVKPELRTIDYAIDNPGFVDAYEQTPIYSKVSGFIKHFYVDIGSEVKKGELLAEISVPELDEDHQRKMAQVELGQKAGRAGPAIGRWWPRATCRTRSPRWPKRRPT